LRFIGLVQNKIFSIDKIYDGSSLSTAVVNLSLAGFKNIVVERVSKGFYFEGLLNFEKYKDKEISWKENVTRVLNVPDNEPLFNYLLKQKPKDVLKYYFEIEKGFPSRVPIDRERARMMMADMKLIGNFVAEKIKNNIKD
jgi:hypothetical protein